MTAVDKPVAATGARPVRGLRKPTPSAAHGAPVGPPVLLRGNARRLPLADASVDCIVTSPPYYALRSYRDAGVHIPGQIGDEATPEEYIEALLEVTAECARVLRRGGSMFVNLGDKYAERSAPPRPGGIDDDERLRRPAHRPARGRRGSTPVKSLLLLPERYRVAVVDQLGLIARAVIIWGKPNPMPESITDRVARTHEDWVHITRSPRYYESTDEIRLPHIMRPQRRPRGRPPDTTARQGQPRQSWPTAARDQPGVDGHPLGKLPGSVWSIPTQPLRLPPELDVEHRAAFPMEWPRRLIAGWCPREVCTACGQGRRLLVATQRVRSGRVLDGAIYPPGAGRLARAPTGRAHTEQTIRTVVGQACDCSDLHAPTRPGVVLDPFSGTGTTPMVAAAGGYLGIGLDLGADYARAATWRVNDPRQRARAAGVAARPRRRPREVDGQLAAFDVQTDDQGA